MTLMTTGEFGVWVKCTLRTILNLGDAVRQVGTNVSSDARMTKQYEQLPLQDSRRRGPSRKQSKPLGFEISG